MYKQQCVIEGRLVTLWCCFAFILVKDVNTAHKNETNKERFNNASV